MGCILHMGTTCGDCCSHPKYGQLVCYDILADIGQASEEGESLVLIHTKALCGLAVCALAQPEAQSEPVVLGKQSCLSIASTSWVSAVPFLAGVGH